MLGFKLIHVNKRGHWAHKNYFGTAIWTQMPTPAPFARQHFNFLANGIFEDNFRWAIVELISVIDNWGISCETALCWFSMDLTDDKSALVQVLAWCHQASSHYLRQCLPRSTSPNGATRRHFYAIPTKYAYGDRFVVFAVGCYRYEINTFRNE